MTEVVGGALREIDAERSEGFDGMRKETFATGFVDGRFHCVRDVNFKALKRRGYGAGEAGRPGSGDEDVDLLCVRVRVHRKSYVLCKI
jgi:hypothetical protein